MSANPSIPLPVSENVRHIPAARLDRVGIAASLACAIHCLATPFLLLLLPVAGTIWAHPLVHWVLAALVLPLALVVVYRGYRHHRRHTAMVAAVLGAGFIVAGLLLPEFAGFVGSNPPSVEAAPLAEATPCTETCCPTLSFDQTTGAARFNFPAGSIATLIGSVLLVLAHAINLYGCHCFSRTPKTGASPCGCPG